MHRIGQTCCKKDGETFLYGTTGVVTYHWQEGTVGREGKTCRVYLWLVGSYSCYFVNGNK